MSCWANNYPCISALRTYVIIINILNSLLGAVLIVIGCLLVSKDDDCGTDCMATPGRISIFFFLIGLYILVLGLSGIFGALSRFRNWGIILHIWLAWFALIFHLILAVGLLYMSGVDDLDSCISSNFSSSYKEYGDDFATTLGIDLIQGTFRCCGANGTDDFSDDDGAASYWVENKSGYPCSCCSGFACDNSTTPDNLHSSGCTSKLSSFSGSGLDWLAAIITLCFLLSLLNLIFSYILINNRKAPCCRGCCWCCVAYRTPPAPAPKGGKKPLIKS